MTFVPHKGPDGKRRYGCWAGRPWGEVENLNRCVAIIHLTFTAIPRQCSRLRGYGPEKMFCKQHAKDASEEDLK